MSQWNCFSAIHNVAVTAVREMRQGFLPQPYLRARKALWPFWKGRMETFSNSKSSSGTRPLQRNPWLAHLQLIATLPYPLLTLVPTLCEVVRAGLDADHVAVGIAEGDPPMPAAMWGVLQDEAMLRWAQDNLDATFGNAASLREQVMTDGESVRRMLDSPAFTCTPMFAHLYAPLNLRWGMGIPFHPLPDGRRCFLYLNRREAAGRFSDAEQARLRLARDRLRGLGGMRTAVGLAPAPSVEIRSAMVRLDETGRMVARSPGAYELLFLCCDLRFSAMQWARDDIQALPDAVAARTLRLLDPRSAVVQDEVVLALECGSMRVRLDALLKNRGPEREVVISMSWQEPADLAVARELQHWPLTPRQMQIVVASVRQPCLRDMAVRLGCTVGTLKGYINTLHARIGVSSREQLVAMLLARARERTA